jgi:hypothetical protein
MLIDTFDLFDIFETELGKKSLFQAIGEKNSRKSR